MAITPDGKTLLPMLEGALTTDPNQRRLFINEFDVRARAYTGRQWSYRLDSAANAIGDLTAVTQKRFLVIERDNLEGAAALFKKIFLVDLDQVDAEGFLVKHEVANLLEIRDPDNLARTWAGFPLSISDNRKRDPAECANARRAGRQQLSVQQWTRHRPARSQRVHRDSTGSASRGVTTPC